MKLFEDQNARQRFLGVMVWFVLLMVFVPSWYANPVNFQPADVVAKEGTVSSKRVLFTQSYKLPPSVDEQQQLELAKQQAKIIADEDQALKGVTKEPISIEDLVVSNASVTNVPSTVEPEPEVTPAQSPDKVEVVSSKPKSYWILLLSSQPTKQGAEAFKAKVEKLGYKVSIKYFKKNQVYSVRVIEIESQAKARTVKEKLDKIFNLKDSIIRYVNNQ